MWQIVSLNGIVIAKMIEIVKEIYFLLECKELLDTMDIDTLNTKIDDRLFELKCEQEEFEETK